MGLMSPAGEAETKEVQPRYQEDTQTKF
jgi:hypothetical protein